MALGSCSTAASCSRLVDENGLASSTGGRRWASTRQLQLSHWAVRATYDAAQPTTSVDPAWDRLTTTRPHRVYVFASRDFLSIVASADQHSKISARAPRSGNAATLPTLQLASRQAGCATRPAFRHRKQAHERSARARLCHSSARAWRYALHTHYSSESNA